MAQSLTLIAAHSQVCRTHKRLLTFTLLEALKSADCKRLKFLKQARTR
jgi:hypothetical protein